MRGKPIQNLIEITSTALDMLMFKYPGFVYGSSSLGNSIPVFCFHGVEPASLEAMLDYLSNNRYVTLSADEYISVLSGRRSAPPRSIVLTFDDGWGSLWSVGFPLIKKYSTRIVVFLCPGRIENRARYCPTLDDLKAGRCNEIDVMGRDESDQPLLTWEEISEMHNSGLVDFQSHSYNHSLVYRASSIVDFLNPSMLKGHNLMELPFIYEKKAVGTKPHVRLGEPLYRSAPRLSDTRRLFVDQIIADGCAAFVEKHGGGEFFTRSDWHEELENITRELLPSTREWRVETEQEQIEAIRFEMAESKRTIEEMLPGKIVRHICYPWHAAGSIAVDQARKAGYIAGYWGKIDGRYYTPIPGDPSRIARLGSDYFFRLPGKGRDKLNSILMRKIFRRARQGSPYLAH